MPINLRQPTAHWFVIIFVKTEHTWQMFNLDSMSEMSETAQVQAGITEVCNFLQRYKGFEFRDNIATPVITQQQPDGVNCGVFLCHNVELLASTPNWQEGLFYSPSDVQKKRTEIKNCLWYLLKGEQVPGQKVPLNCPALEFWLS